MSRKKEAIIDAEIEQTVDKRKKQFGVIYTVGTNPEVYIAEGTAYYFGSEEAPPNSNGDKAIFPVVFVEDTEEDTLEIVPMSSVSKIRWNWGLNAEKDKILKTVESSKKKISDRLHIPIDPMYV